MEPLLNEYSKCAVLAAVVDKKEGGVLGGGGSCVHLVMIPWAGFRLICTVSKIMHLMMTGERRDKKSGVIDEK